MWEWALVGAVVVIIILMIRRNTKDQRAASPLEDAGLLAGTVYKVHVRTDPSDHAAIADATVLVLTDATGRKFELPFDPSRVSLHFDIRKPPQFVRPKMYMSGLVTLTKAVSFDEVDPNAPPEAIYPVGLEEKPAAAA